MQKRLQPFTWRSYTRRQTHISGRGGGGEGEGERGGGGAEGEGGGGGGGGREGGEGEGREVGEGGEEGGEVVLAYQPSDTQPPLGGSFWGGWDNGFFERPA